MRDLSLNDRCTYILDSVLGAPGSLDEEVLRRASLDALKDLMQNQSQSVDESVSAFMSAFVYQTTLVELTSHKGSMKVTPEQMLNNEKSLKQYIKAHSKFSGIMDGSRVTVTSLMNKCAELRDRALNLIRGVTP